jgi:hypothetical protein
MCQKQRTKGGKKKRSVSGVRVWNESSSSTAAKRRHINRAQFFFNAPLGSKTDI